MLGKEEVAVVMAHLSCRTILKRDRITEKGRVIRIEG